ncbi:HipA domain-containing protein [Actinoplanes sp. NPDC051411]|uniref:HipA domain-containing protein n=1 Tax=Actinoplanes sp. NPDC051411 TaxID=3155522 RepID=UPI003435843C
MRIDSPGNLGRYLREQRRVAGFNQTDLAAAAGVSRRWLADLEAGKPSVELGLALRVIAALGQFVDVQPGSTTNFDLDTYLEPPTTAAQQSTTRTLVAVLGGVRIGTLTQSAGGKLTFSYDHDYRQSPDAMPLSLSMPLSAADHDGPEVRAFCRGLLPDNDGVLERWGRDFHVSAGNPFALLNHVGEDCAGAVQFVGPDRLRVMLAGLGSVEPLTEEQVAGRLRALRRDSSAWHLSSGGQFSLAGAQAKTALHWDAISGQWGDPSGVVPTTHILKPAITGFDDHDLNEHLCLRAARLAGLRTASTSVRSFAGERAIVIERYDRRSGPRGSVVRVHQEDICQSLGVLPTTKYQNEGGPSPEQIVALIRRAVGPPTVAETEVGRFVDALALNWLIAGTDAHAKNYSLLITAWQVRLAPLYDVASILPYDDVHLPKLRLAMRIGTEYRVTAITGRRWATFAERNGLDPERVVARVGELAALLPGAFRKAAADDDVVALDSDLPAMLADRVAEHVERCQAALARR